MANALLNMLQAASNSAASNISAPVDGIAWLLRKAGIPVPENAIGGSDWMAQQGLMAPVQQGAGQVAGETLGLLAGPVAALKAPQIAGGLLAAERNALAPRTLNPQTGAIVWHGSPHKFDKFDASKIGTGEGAQAYGHGLYLAERPKTAKTYMHAGMIDNATGDISAATKSRYLEYKDRLAAELRNAPEMEAKAQAMSLSDDAAIRLLNTVSQPFVPPYLLDFDPSLRAAMKLREEIAPSLYKVDLPDEKIARMLDWDKPLSEQPKAVQKLAKVRQRDFAAEEALIAKAQALGVSPTSLPEYAQLEKLMDKAGKQGRITGRDLYELFGGSVNGAEKLRRAGIPGIRYLDGGSRSAGAGSSNFVVFPGEENALRILERNGQPSMPGLLD